MRVFFVQYVRITIIFGMCLLSIANLRNIATGQNVVELEKLNLTEIGQKLELAIPVIQSKKDAKFSFEITNETGSVLSPHNLSKSCSCFDLIFPQGEWKHGELRKVLVEIAYDSPKILGATAVISDEMKQKILSIDLHGEIRPLFRCVPPVLKLDGQVEKQEVELEIIRNFDYVSAKDLVIKQSLPSIGKMTVDSITDASVRAKFLINRDDLFIDNAMIDVHSIYLSLSWKTVSGPEPLSQKLIDIGYPDGLTLPVELLGVPKITPKLVRLKKLDLEGTRVCTFLVRSESQKKNWKGVFFKDAQSEVVQAKLEWHRINEDWSRLTVSAKLSQYVQDNIEQYRVEIFGDENFKIHSASVFSD